MIVYLIIDVEVLDKDIYAEYVRKAFKIVKEHGGEYLSRGAKIAPLRGGWNPQRLVLIKFDSKEQMDKCFSSREYLDIVHLRGKSIRSRSIVVEGSVD